MPPHFYCHSQIMGDSPHPLDFYDCNGRWAAGRTYLYMFMARDGDGPMYVKIGVSEDPFSRVTQVQTGCPIRIIRAAMMKCMSRDQARKIEKAVHVDLSPFSSSGEWFRFDWSDKAQRGALNSAIECNMASVRDWKLEQIDLSKAYAMKRLIEKNRRGRYRARVKRSLSIKSASGI